MPDQPQPSRRQVVGSSVAVVAVLTSDLALGACRLRVGQPRSAHPRPQPPSADEIALASAASQARALGVLYAEAAQVRPDLAGRLAPLAADHADHLRVLSAAASAALSSTSPSAGASASSSPAYPLPTSRTAVADLMAAERTVLAARSSAVAGAGPDAARLLASLSACGAQHVELLGRMPGKPS